MHSVYLTNSKGPLRKHLVDGVWIRVGAAEPADQPRAPSQIDQDVTPILAHERHGHIQPAGSVQGIPKSRSDEAGLREEARVLVHEAEDSDGAPRIAIGPASCTGEPSANSAKTSR